MTIKNMPDALYRRLTRSADLSRRSINGEAIALLERALGAERVDPAEALDRAAAVRERLAARGVYVTDTELTGMREEGRA